MIFIELLNMFILVRLKYSIDLIASKLRKHICGLRDFVLLCIL